MDLEANGHGIACHDDWTATEENNKEFSKFIDYPPSIPESYCIQDVITSPVIYILPVGVVLWAWIMGTSLETHYMQKV